MHMKHCTAGRSSGVDKTLTTATASVGQADITLHLDPQGVIREASLSSALSDENIEGWVGRPWSDTIIEGDTTNGKVTRILDDVRSNGVSAFRQVTQRFPSGRELPMEYTTVRLDDDSNLVAVGKSLQTVAELHSRLIAAQQTMERDYWKLREIETRYRLVFDASSEAVLLVRASDMTVTEVNPTARTLMGFERDEADTVTGSDLRAHVAAEEREHFQSMLLRAREQGKAPGILVHLGRNNEPCVARASLINARGIAMFLLQIKPAGAAAGAPAPAEDFSVESLLEIAPDAFVVLNRDGTILRANPAFLELAQQATEGAVKGEPLSRWLGRPGADMTVLLATVNRHNVVRLFTTVLHGELGTDTTVELSAVGDTRSNGAYIGVLIRDVSRRLSSGDSEERLGSALGVLTEQVGNSTLRKLVGNTVAVVEKHYIEAALSITNGNRTAAAELLGLSRQSLYAKLNRYGFDPDTQAAPQSA